MISPQISFGFSSKISLIEAVKIIKIIVITGIPNARIMFIISIAIVSPPSLFRLYMYLKFVILDYYCECVCVEYKILSSGFC